MIIACLSCALKFLLALLCFFFVSVLRSLLLRLSCLTPSFTLLYSSAIVEYERMVKLVLMTLLLVHDDSCEIDVMTEGDQVPIVAVANRHSRIFAEIGFWPTLLAHFQRMLDGQLGQRVQARNCRKLFNTSLTS